MIIYPTRYRAEKHRVKGAEVVVKISGGYAVMTYAQYRVWRNQK